MNILMLTYEVADEGGNYIRCFSLAKELVTLGHQVTLLASNKCSALRDKRTVRHGVIIIEIACPLPHRIRHNGTSPFQVIGRMMHIIGNRHYDVVYGFGHRPSVFFPAFLYAWVYNKRYIADWADLWGWGGLASYRGGFWGTIVGSLDDLMERFVYRHSNGLTVISSALFRRAISVGIPQANIAIISPGSSTDEIVPLSKTTQRRNHGFSAHDHIVMYVGNAPYDAQLLAQTIIEIFKRDDKALAVVVGRRMEEFDQSLATSKYASRIRRYGFVPHNNIAPLLACGDVMLLPYTNREINTNRYPNKIGDYLASGRPVAANPTGDLARLFHDYHIGVVAPENPVGFARAVITLFKNPRIMKTMGKNARALAKGDFSWKRAAQTFNEFYTRLISINPRK